MNHYSDSCGNRWTTPQIEAKIKRACLRKLEHQRNVHGYNFCEDCKRNDCKPLDCSHNVSRKKAKETGTVEALWDLDNLEILGRSCHKKKDKLDLKFHYDNTGTD